MPSGRPHPRARPNMHGHDQMPHTRDDEASMGRGWEDVERGGSARVTRGGRTQVGGAQIVSQMVSPDGRTE